MIALFIVNNSYIS